MGTCSSYSFKLKYKDKELFYWVFSQCTRGRRASEKTGSFKPFFSISQKNSPFWIFLLWLWFILIIMGTVIFLAKDICVPGASDMTPVQALAADSSSLSQAASCRALLMFPAPTQMPRSCLPSVFSLWVGHDACVCVLIHSVVSDSLRLHDAYRSVKLSSCPLSSTFQRREWSTLKSVLENCLKAFSR